MQAGRLFLMIGLDILTRASLFNDRSWHPDPGVSF